MKRNYYSLLFIDKERRSLSPNISRQDFDSQIEAFLGCCDFLRRSLAFWDPDGEYTMLTNDASFVKSRLPLISAIDIPFEVQVPEGIEFQAAHRKIDAFRFLSGIQDEYSILLDADVVCIGPPPVNLLSCISRGLPTYYDITAAIYPEYGRERLAEEKSLVGGRQSIGIWAGGEYLGGPGTFFTELCTRIDRFETSYFKQAPLLHHQGDEMLTSIAIEEMLLEGRQVIEIGRFGAIGRYWSIETRHIQVPLESHSGNFLVHLPADKVFLAAQSEPEGFWERYREHARMKSTPPRQSSYERILARLRAVAGKIRNL